MKSTKIYLSLVLFFVISITIAQPGGGPPHDMKDQTEKVEAMKVAFFTQRLNITVSEAKVFWPVYDQYQKELNELRDKHRKDLRKHATNESKLSEKDYELMADGEMLFRQNELDIMKKYHAQLKTVISMEKLAGLYKAEIDFKRELLRQLQDKNKRSGRPEPVKRRG